MNATQKNTVSSIEYDENEFTEYLDEIFPDCEIAGRKYSTSDALQSVDPIAFDCAMFEWTNEQPKWECDTCNSQFEEEEDALNCCPEWTCEKCGQSYDNEEDAENCCTEEENDE